MVLNRLLCSLKCTTDIWDGVFIWLNVSLWEGISRTTCSRVREPRRTAVPHGPVSGFMVMGLPLGLPLASYLACAYIWSYSGSFPDTTHPSKPRWILAWGLLRRLLEHIMRWNPLPSFWPLPNSTSFQQQHCVSCWELCCETTHANSYYCVYPGGVGSFGHQFPNRIDYSEDACPNWRLI